MRYRPNSAAFLGGIVVLAVDTAVIASLVNGIGGLLVSNVGNAGSYGNLLFWSGTWTASGIGVTHPGPAFSGLVVRAGAFAHEPTQGLFAVSQGEDLLIK